MKYFLVSLLFAFASKVSFGQTGNAHAEQNMQNGLYAVFNDDIQVTPYLFNSLTKVNDTLFIFNANPVLRGILQLSVTIGDTLNLSGTGFIDEQDIFEGLISVRGKIYGGEGLRKVEHIKGVSNLLFKVQNQEYVEDYQNPNYALMNASGILLSYFEYKDLYLKNGLFTGDKEINSGNGSTVIQVFLDIDGKPISK